MQANGSRSTTPALSSLSLRRADPEPLRWNWKQKRPVPRDRPLSSPHPAGLWNGRAIANSLARNPHIEANHQQPGDEGPSESDERGNQGGAERKRAVMLLLPTHL